MSSATQTDWRIAGEEVGHCNCDWGCPCQFNALPTHGNCYALIGFEVEEGNFGDVSLDGVRYALIAWWPKAIHEGDGHIQVILDEASSQEQRDAVAALWRGEHGGAAFEIFAAVAPNRPEPVVAPVEIKTDREARVASIKVPGFGESRAEPIKNPVDGSEHRVRIVLPEGFEYEEAEVGNTVTATASGPGPLTFELENSYAQLNRFDWSNAA
jgi:hypothetical protein